MVDKKHKDSPASFESNLQLLSMASHMLRILAFRGDACCRSCSHSTLSIDGSSVCHEDGAPSVIGTFSVHAVRSCTR